MYIYCEICEVKKFTFCDWMDHLLDKSHQEQFNFLQWTKEMNDKSIVVQDVNKAIQVEDVAWFFASEGFLADFYIRNVKRKRIFVLQFDCRNTAEQCIAKKTDLRIGGAKPTLQWKEMADQSLRTEEFDFKQRHLELTQNLASLPMAMQLQTFIKETTLSEKDVDDRHHFLVELTSLIKERFPNCILYPFGSTISGLGDVDSDIDVCVDPEGKFNSDMSYTPDWDEKLTTFNRVLALMRNKSDWDQHQRRGNKEIEDAVLSSVFPIRHARVPIIKIVHKKTEIKCDLSFENLLSVQNSKMIAFYISLDPRIRPLILLVRYWGKFHDLIGCFQIKNYTMILLVLTFLQKKWIVPSVHFLQSQPGNKQVLIDDWDASFLADKEAIMAAFNASREKIPAAGCGDATASIRSIFNILYEFFDMYGKLDFETQVICPYLGQVISKRRFESVALLPQAMKRFKDWYAHNIDRTDTKDLLRLDCPLCVTDPFNLSFNVGSCASEVIVHKFQKACEETAGSLKEMLSDPDFESRQCITGLFFPVLTASGNRKR